MASSSLHQALRTPANGAPRGFGSGARLAWGMLIAVGLNAGLLVLLSHFAIVPEFSPPIAPPVQRVHVPPPDLPPPPQEPPPPSEIIPEVPTPQMPAMPLDPLPQMNNPNLPAMAAETSEWQADLPAMPAAPSAQPTPAQASTSQPWQCLTDGSFLQYYYPTRAKSRRLTGRTRVRLTVGGDGVVRDVEIINSQPAGVFDRAARRAAKKLRYQPPEGTPSSAQTVIETELVWEVK